LESQTWSTAAPASEAALGEMDDSIGHPHRREAVADQQGRAPLGELAEP
jgi:hypothetical protein